MQVSSSLPCPSASPSCLVLWEGEGWVILLTLSFFPGPSEGRGGPSFLPCPSTSPSCLVLPGQGRGDGQVTYLPGRGGGGGVSSSWPGGGAGYIPTWPCGGGGGGEAGHLRVARGPTIKIFYPQGIYLQLRDIPWLY